MPGINFDSLKHDLPLEKVLHSLGWRGRGGWGDSTRGPCPLHEAVTANSRVMWVCNGRWYCHRCKRGGDLLSLWSELHPTMSLIQIARDLAEKYGVTLRFLRREKCFRRPRTREEDW